MILNQNDCVLLIIDIQEKLLNAVFNKDILEKKSSTMTKACSILNIPVIVTEQYPKGLGETFGELKKGGQAFEKITFSALENKEVWNALKNTKRKNIMIMGIETHICVHQTVNALIQAGFSVTVVKDACGSRLEEEYLSALEVMKNSGAEIKTTEMIIFELLKTAKHENFKEIQALIK
jgi:nicotinamidase-related amidase